MARRGNNNRKPPARLPGAPPFPESERVTVARRTGATLAASDLPILLSGEVGTGKRTMAGELAKIRGPSTTLSAFDRVHEKLRETRAGASVVLHHVHALDDRARAEVSAMMSTRRIRLIATAEGPLAPELAALVGVSLPPLRDREGEVVSWAELFVELAAAVLGIAPPKLSNEARSAVLAHSWPGNLAELESVMRRSVLFADKSKSIDRSALGFVEQLTVQPLEKAVESFRSEYVAKVLSHFNGNRTHAARALGVDPRTIFRYLEKERQ